MKEIKAIIQPNRLPRLRSALRNIPDFPGMTVSKVEGCGHDGAAHSVHGIQEELTDYSPKARVDIVAPDHMVEGILQTLIEVGHTGQTGGGIVWVTPVERMVRLSEDVTEIDC